MVNKRIVFRAAWLITVLVAFSLGCKLVNQVGEVVSLVTEVKGLATDVDLEGLSTDIDLEGLSTDIDLEGLSTEMNLEGMLTDMPFLEETQVVATPAGFPVDIPIMAGDKSEMSGTPNRLEYFVDAGVQQVVDFYRREMPARGWVEASGGTTQAEEAEMYFQQGSRKVTVRVVEDFFFGAQIIITVSDT
jgi:hypothetical protein